MLQQEIDPQFLMFWLLVKTEDPRISLFLVENYINKTYIISDYLLLNFTVSKLGGQKHDYVALQK